MGIVSTIQFCLAVTHTVHMCVGYTFMLIIYDLILALVERTNIRRIGNYISLTVLIGRSFSKQGIIISNCSLIPRTTDKSSLELSFQYQVI